MLVTEYKYSWEEENHHNISFTVYVNSVLTEGEIRCVSIHPY